MSERTLKLTAEKLRAHALTYPETYEEAPWGDRVVKVRGKIFFFCGVHDGKLQVTSKLPTSGRELLKRAYAEPTHYGMGKHGWVSCTFTDGKNLPEGEIIAWIDESFRAVAPKKLVVGLAAPSPKKPRAKPPANSPAKAKSAPKPRAKAVLVCSDRVRAERAVGELAARAVAVEVVEDADSVALGRAKALIVDIGRNPRQGLALAAQIDASDRPIHLFVTGVRDAEQERKLRALGSAESFRQPPGDAAVADAVVAALLPTKRSRIPS
jgi:predicted DNA-binding protein (MmcQ/YjbR family)